ncbi:MAG: hypothetical protein ACRDJX_11205 [Solirubrobacteraceae bacterium]
MAVFAFAAVSAVSASAAAPEWGHCVAKKKGRYADANCQHLDLKKGKADGSHEWIPGGGAACYATKHGRYANAACTVSGLKKGKPKGKFEKTGGGAFTAKSGAAILQAQLDGCDEIAIAACDDEGEDVAFEFYNGETEREEKFPAREGFVNEGYLAVECAGETASGTASGSKEVTNVAVVFHGCYSPSLGVGCSSASVAEGKPVEGEAGEIVINALKGELGYIEGKGTSDPKVGVLLEPAVAGGDFTTFLCGVPSQDGGAPNGALLVVGEGNAAQGHVYTNEVEPGEGQGGHDGIISPITPVNQMTSTFTQEYTQTGVKGGTDPETAENIPEKFEGGRRELIETKDLYPKEFYEYHEERGVTWSKAAEVLTNTNTLTEGLAEIKG